MTSQKRSSRVHRADSPLLEDRSPHSPMPVMCGGQSQSSSRIRGKSSSSLSRGVLSTKLGGPDWKNLPLDPPPIIIERAPMKRNAQSASAQISGIFYFYQTVENTSLVEVLHKKKSEVVGSPNARVIYWKKTKSLILDEGQLHKISFKDMKKSRFGVELSRVGLHNLKHFQTVIVKEKLYIIGGIREGKPTNNCFEIDLKHRTVFNTPNMPFVQMNQLLVTVDKSSFYCLGEADPLTESEPVTKKMGLLPTSPTYRLFSYNTESRVWTKLSSLLHESQEVHKSNTHSASSRTVRPHQHPESLPFSPCYMISDKHFLFVVDRTNAQLVAKYRIAEDKWV